MLKSSTILHKKYRSDTLITALFICFYTIIIFFSKDIPFFWTMGNVGFLANKIYDSNFSQIIFTNDNGMPPLYVIYLAFTWLIFGKSLLISHLAVLPFLVGIIIQLKKIARALYPGISLLSLYLLLLFEPTFLTVCIMGGYDLAIIFFFLFALNAIYFQKKNIFFFLSLIVLPLINLRGFTIVFGILFYDIYVYWKSFAKKFKFTQLIKYFSAYIISAVLFCCWLLYHYCAKGWYIVNPSFDSFNRVNSLEMFLRNFIYIFWKIFDFGRFIIWMPVLFFSCKLLLNKKLFKKENHAYVFLGFSLLYYFVFFWPTSYPVSHRYLLLSLILVIIPFLMIVDKIPYKLVRFSVIGFTCIALFMGNFIVYPERFGNGWDASIKFIPYFKIEKELDAFIKTNNIDPNHVGAKYPMHFSRYDTYLTKDDFSFTDLDKKEFYKWDYIIQSNISNTFTSDEIITLNNKWVRVKELRAWPVYIKLFKNPH